MLVDPHCHLDDPELSQSFGQVCRQAMSVGVQGALIPGYGPQRWPRQTELLEKGGKFLLWGGFGLHPWALEGCQEDCSQSLEIGWQTFGQRWGDRLVAIGEFGLDRSANKAPLELQRLVFEWHLKKARQADLPVILHLVRSDGLAKELLQKDGPWNGVVHGFSSHRQTVPGYLELGLSLSFGSALLASEKVRQALIVTPHHRLMFETDAPKGPIGSGAHPKGPGFLMEIVQAASQVLGKSVEYLLTRHRENCDRVFGFGQA